MAVLCAETSEAARNKTVARLVKDMQGKDDTRKHLGLLVVGELGRQTDLSRVQDLQVDDGLVVGWDGEAEGGAWRNGTVRLRVAATVPLCW